MTNDERTVLAAIERLEKLEPPRDVALHTADEIAGEAGLPLSSTVVALQILAAGDVLAAPVTKFEHEGEPTVFRLRPRSRQERILDAMRSDPNVTEWAPSGVAARINVPVADVTTAMMHMAKGRESLLLIGEMASATGERLFVVR